MEILSAEFMRAAKPQFTWLPSLIQRLQYVDLGTYHPSSQHTEPGGSLYSFTSIWNQGALSFSRDPLLSRTNPLPNDPLDRPLDWPEHN